MGCANVLKALIDMNLRNICYFLWNIPVNIHLEDSFGRSHFLSSITTRT